MAGWLQGNAFKRGLRPKDMRERQRLQDLIDAQAAQIQLLKEEINMLKNADYDPTVSPGSRNPPCGY